MLTTFPIALVHKIPKGETSARAYAAVPLPSPPGCLRALLQQGLALMDVLSNVPSPPLEGWRGNPSRPSAQACEPTGSHVAACEEAGYQASRNTVPRKGRKATRNIAALAAFLMVAVLVL